MSIDIKGIDRVVAESTGLIELLYNLYNLWKKNEKEVKGHNDSSA